MPKILIIEDEEPTALALEFFCQKLGYETIESVNNYHDAMHTIHLNKPDLLICDIKIKGEKNGLDIAYDAQQKYGVPTIFLTAYYDEDILKKAKKVSFYGYIVKPYKENELEATIRLTLAQIDKNRSTKKRYIDINGYTFDMKTMKLYDEKDDIPISKKMAKLLYFLSKYLGQVKSYEEIIEYVYQGEEASLDTLRHLVKRTRDIVKKENIKSVKGIGYKLVEK